MKNALLGTVIQAAAYALALADVPVEKRKEVLKKMRDDFELGWNRK